MASGGIILLSTFNHGSGVDDVLDNLYTLHSAHARARRCKQAMCQHTWCQALHIVRLDVVPPLYSGESFTGAIECQRPTWAYAELHGRMPASGAYNHQQIAFHFGMPVDITHRTLQVDDLFSSDNGLQRFKNFFLL